MSIVRDRARVFIRIGIALTIIAVVASLSCSDKRRPVSDGETETWDATAFFLAGIFTASQSLEDNSLLVENFRANYEWLRDVFIPHLGGTPKHTWTSCPEYCIPAVEKLTKGDQAKEEQIKSALTGSQSQ